MAHAAAHPLFQSVFKTIADAFLSLWQAGRMKDEFEARMRRMQALDSLSDAELAVKGLNRDQIARHVFQDLYYV